MKTFTYNDLREYLLYRIYKDKYVRLAEFIKKEISDDPDFNLFEYLYNNRDNIIFTAKNKEDLIKKRDEYIKNKFKIMKFGLIAEIKSKINDYLLNYP
ncbi:MAG: hypothetical protein ACP5UN_03625 [Candidatus Micrarchaeia archaeon]